MKISYWLPACAAILLIVAPVIQAQEKRPAETTAPETIVPAKLQVVLTEFEGTNKVSSLPYTLPLTISSEVLGHRGQMYSLRMGVRVPVTTTSSKTGENSLTYLDVGTNIDSRAYRSSDDRYTVDLRIERSSLYVAFKDKEDNFHGKEWTAGEPPPGNSPMIRQFRGDVALVLRDGQQSEATVATDPLTGRVLKVEVLLTVSK